VECGASTSGGSFRSCPLNRAVDGEFVKASIVDVPTAMGSFYVIKSLRLNDERWPRNFRQPDR
jgi:hypothetical protein